MPAAAPTQLPWNDVGASPCCCGTSCFDASSGSPVPSYATNSSPVPLENSWFDITADEYSALKAGGTYAADFGMFLATYREASASCRVDGVSTGWIKRACNRELSASATNLSLAVTEPDVVSGQPSSLDQNCMLVMSADSLNVNEYDWRPAYACGPATNNYSSFTTSLRFARSLGKVGSQSKLSCASHANTNAAAGAGWRNWLSLLPNGNGCGSNSAPTLELHSGNIIGTIPTGITAQPHMQAVSNLTLSVKFQINGGTQYSVPNTALLGYSANSGIRDQFFGNQSILCGGTSCAGGVVSSSTITYLIKFTSAPP